MTEEEGPCLSIVLVVVYPSLRVPPLLVFIIHHSYRAGVSDFPSSRPPSAIGLMRLATRCIILSTDPEHAGYLERTEPAAFVRYRFGGQRSVSLRFMDSRHRRWHSSRHRRILPK